MEEKANKVEKADNVQAEVVAKIMGLINEGTDICAVRDSIENSYTKLKIERMFPVSIEVNNFINNYSPVLPYCLKADDVFGITFGSNEKKKEIYSFQGFFDETYLDYYKYIKEAFEAGKKTCKEDVRIKEITVAISEILSSYDNYLSPIRNISGFMVSDSKTIIPNVLSAEVKDYNSLDTKIVKNESYFICVYAANTIDSNLNGVFYKNPSYYYRTDKKRELKSKREKILLNHITPFGVGNIFSFHDLIQKCQPKEYTKKMFGDLITYKLVEPIYGLILPDPTVKVFRYGETIHI